MLAGLDGNMTPVGWDTSDAPYLTSAHWSRGGPALLQVPRATSGRCGCWPWPTTAREPICDDTDPDWVDIVPGLPPGRRAASWSGWWPETARTG